MNMKSRALCSLIGIWIWVALPAGSELVLVEDGRSIAPIVDGEVVLEHEERGEPLAGDGHDRVGFFFYTPARVRQVNA